MLDNSPHSRASRPSALPPRESLFFYGYWKIEYIPLLLFSICFNYAAAETIRKDSLYSKPQIVQSGCQSLL